MISISYVSGQLSARQSRVKRLHREQVELCLNGWARLEHRGDEVQLRRKGLALLCYLALEGPTERDYLADLLWGRGSSGNLRVELHRLRQALEPIGFDLFKERQDPLRLSKNLKIALPTEKADSLEILRGLDDISPQYQDWLEFKRAELSKPGTLQVREALVEDVAEGLSFPYLLIVQGQPETGHLAFAQALAKQLKLPFISGKHGSARAVRFMDAAAETNESLLKHILDDRDSVWVIERSAFGEDTDFLLELRGAYRPDKMRFVRLPHLSWRAARQTYLQALTFSEAAKLYCATGGHPGYISELLALRPTHGFAEDAPLPQRIRAAYQLEARNLSCGSRYALERLSVHPSQLSEGLVQAFEAKAFLDELERHGWLKFEDGWRFVDNVVRNVLYESLSEGQRQRYHQVAAQQFSNEADVTAYYYHCQKVNKGAEPSDLRNHVDGWAQSVLNPGTQTHPQISQQLYALGEEQALLEDRVLGNVDFSGESLAVVRNSLMPDISRIDFEVLERAQLLNIAANLHVNAPRDLGVSGAAFPLRLSLIGERTQTVYFAAVASAERLDTSTWLLPLETTSELWLYAEPFSELRLESAATDAVLELDLRCYAVAKEGESVTAYTLG